MILVGDVGGTKTLLEIGKIREGCWQPVFARRYAAIDFSNLSSLLRRFLLEWSKDRQSQDTITHACFGVAGPAFNDRAQMTNLPWIVDGADIAAEFGFAYVRVVNDFAAAASGVELLKDADLYTLQPGDPIRTAPRLVIGAGTGLGVAYLIPKGADFEVIAGESGHVGFAPATMEQLELWRELYQRNGRVSVEDVVSGSGLTRIYDFIVRTTSGSTQRNEAANTRLTPAAITRAAIEVGDPASVQALDMFIDCFGEAAGNFALAMLACGGVYVAGGIAPKIITRLREGGFLNAFNAKGAHSDTVRKIPLHIVNNEHLGLLGCALLAIRK